MAKYDFRSRKTGKIKEYEMKISEYDQFVKDHPELEKVPNVVGFGDPISLGRIRPPADFQKGVLDRIAATVPGAKKGMRRTRWGNVSEV